LDTFLLGLWCIFNEIRGVNNVSLNSVISLRVICFLFSIINEYVYSVQVVFHVWFVVSAIDWEEWNVPTVNPGYKISKERDWKVQTFVAELTFPLSSRLCPLFMS
jgi:hypothetical protein